MELPGDILHFPGVTPLASQGFPPWKSLHRVIQMPVSAFVTRDEASSGTAAARTTATRPDRVATVKVFILERDVDNEGL